MNRGTPRVCIIRRCRCQIVDQAAPRTPKVIDRLEEMGYVSRSPDPADRRATMVGLTAAGREAIGRAKLVIDAGLEEIWSTHLTDDQSIVLIEVMDRVLEANRDWH